ncbi:hypothetical protein BTM460_10360 [Helicobacter pylori]
MLLESMNATDLETYAALQKPSHVFGNYWQKAAAAQPIQVTAVAAVWQAS